MNILVIGSGGREHALCWKIKKSPLIKNLYCLPGNAGIKNHAICIREEVINKENIYNACKKFEIDLVVIGPEDHLAQGLTDYLTDKKIMVFGPSKTASTLESSKSFTKNLCLKHKIPTASYEIFHNEQDAIDFIRDQKYPIVIKVDGLAAGKGVIIPNSFSEASSTISEIFSGKFGNAGKTVIIEEFLNGVEASFFALSDGNTVIPFSTAQDYKRAFDDNKGPNTGGMGAFSPSKNIDMTLEKKIMDLIILPTFKALKQEGIIYKGILYAGLMLKDNSPKLIEYNVRFGDPECQVILSRLKSDIVPLLIAVSKGNLKDTKIEWENLCSLIVIMATKGYPGKYPIKTEIMGLEKITHSDCEVFHSGTIIEKEILKSNGGRVLGITSNGRSLSIARKKAYNGIKKIRWDMGFYRKDIGKNI